MQCNGGYFLQTEKTNRNTKLRLLQLASRKTILDADKRGKTKSVELQTVEPRNWEPELTEPKEMTVFITTALGQRDKIVR